MKKRGETDILVASLLIVIGIVIVIIVWNIINSLTLKSSSNVEIEPFLFKGNLDYSLVGSDNIEINVNRNYGGEKISGIKFIFKEKNGQIHSYENEIDYPEITETKTYNLQEVDVENMEFANLEEILLFFIYKTSNGNKKYSIELDTIKIAENLGEECTPKQWYRDNDYDNFGNPDDSDINCFPPEDYIKNNADCDDNNANINPSAYEVCDGADNNCDSVIDEEDICCSPWTNVKCGQEGCLMSQMKQTRISLGGVCYLTDKCINNATCEIIANAVSYWELEGNANDSIGNNNGKCYQWTGASPVETQCNSMNVSGKYGNAMLFGNLYKNFIDIPDNETLKGMSQLTINLWMNPTVFKEYQQLISKGASVWGDYSLFETGNISNKVRFFIRKVNISECSLTVYSTQMNLNQWHMITAVLNSSNIHIYTDGVISQALACTGTNVFNPGPLRIGVNSNNSKFFEGIIDEIIIWNRALTSQEINAIYKL